MAIRDHFLRYMSIIRKLRNHGEATFEDICDTMQRDAEILDFKTDFSKRTFQRDLMDILSLFNIEIKYDFSRKAYHIVEEEEQTDMNNRMLEALDMLNLCKAAENKSPYLIFEKRRPGGTEHFSGLLHAIQNRFSVKFLYQKFWEDDPRPRTADPYALKESQNRWYLVAKDHKDDVIKSFGLDRLSELHITRKKFALQPDFDPNEKFKYCFGVLGDDTGTAEHVILTFDPFQGKYIKSFPLHESQVILLDNSEELRISLDVYITRDLIMELLSYGDKLKVVSPRKLRNELARNHKAGMLKNS